MTRTGRQRWKPVVIALLAAAAASGFGALATDLSAWYYALQKPSWQPPDWLFGPVWTTIFALAALSGLLAWRRAPDATSRRRMLIVFAANVVLNVVWSVLFFRMHRPDFALYEVSLLWSSIVTLMVLMWNYSRTSSLLLTPYLVWVSFASILNLAIIRLNGPFTGG
ncbi:MAG: TspO/MBR family protein [Dokdonella sp.]|uniref:TspO/MBR family protein n=1 Tax=Dokdonella sp. TaxID=2291710 RepID=UPI00326707CB